MLHFLRLQETIDVRLEQESHALSVIISIKSHILFLRDRHQRHEDGHACFTQGLNVDVPKDRDKIVSLISNGLCGLRICPEAEFVDRELRSLRLNRVEEID
jgi:hypothetical protein